MPSLNSRQARIHKTSDVIRKRCVKVGTQTVKHIDKKPDFQYYIKGSETLEHRFDKHLDELEEPSSLNTKRRQIEMFRFKKQLASGLMACSPMRQAKLKGQVEIVPYKNIHQKTYFKTIE